MIRTFTLLGLCLFIAGLEVRAEPPVTSTLQADASKLPAAFARSIKLGDRNIYDAGLEDVLQFLREEHKCTVALDEAGFEKKGIKAVGQKKINLPQMPSAPAGLVMEMIARQVGGTIRVDGEKLTLVPGKARDLKTLIGMPNPNIVANLAKPVALDKRIEGVSLKDILDFLSDKSGLTIVVDEWAFDKTGKKDVSDSQCNLPAHTAPLRGLLVVLAAMVKGTIVVGDELILIVPETNEPQGQKK